MSAYYGATLTQLADQYEGDPRLGRSIMRRIQGTPLQVLKEANLAAEKGLKYGVRELTRGGYHELTVNYGATEDPAKEHEPLADIWSLRANELEKNLWDTEKVYDQLHTLTPDVVSKFRAGVEMLLTGQIAWGTLVYPPGTDTATLNGLINALSMGVESKPLSAPVVQRKLTVTPTTKLRPSFVGVDKVIEGANLARGNDPSTGGPIPQTVLFGMRDGWYLKKMPTVDQTGPTTWDILQEWWWIGEWYHTFVFDEYGTS